jgi:hypothetical protein
VPPEAIFSIFTAPGERHDASPMPHAIARNPVNRTSATCAIGSSPADQVQPDQVQRAAQHVLSWPCVDGHSRLAADTGPPLPLPLNASARQLGRLPRRQGRGQPQGGRGAQRAPPAGPARPLCPVLPPPAGGPGQPGWRPPCHAQAAFYGRLHFPSPHTHTHTIIAPRQVLKERPGWKLLEVEQLGELRVLWMRRTFSNFLEVSGRAWDCLTLGGGGQREWRPGAGLQSLFPARCNLGQQAAELGSQQA